MKPFALAATLALLSFAGLAQADETDPETTVPAPAVAAGPRARVHIKAPQPSYLYRRAAGTTEFVTACQTPCDAEMPLGDTYKIGGKGFKTTSEFSLEASPGGDVDLVVDGPSWLGIIGGGSLVLVGGLTAYIGLLLAVDDCSSTSYGPGCKDMHKAGVGALALGGVGIAVGLLIVFPSLKTDLSTHRESPSKDAFLRTPTWRSAGATETSAPPMTLPVVYSGRF